MRPEIEEYRKIVKETIEKVPPGCVLAACKCCYWTVVKSQIGRQRCEACGFFMVILQEEDVMQGVYTKEEYEESIRGMDESEGTGSGNQSEVLPTESGRRKRLPRYDPGTDPNQSGLWGVGDDS